MAWRVTSQQVEELLLADYEAADDLTPYITTANVVTSAVSSADSGSLLSSTLLEEIEKWLSAHYYTVQNHQLRGQKTADASGEYAGEYGKGLDGSKYGQTAQELDLTGFLRKNQKGNTRLTFQWLGLAPSNQTDYVDRD